jgi:hypothetical protein
MRSWYLTAGGLPDGFETPESAGLLAWTTAPTPSEQIEKTADGLAPTPQFADRPGIHRKLAVAGGAAAVLAAAGLSVAQWKQSTFQACLVDAQAGIDCQRTGDELNWDFQVNQIAGYGGYSAAGVATLLGIGAVLTWRF